jgi:hypothetical protein
MRSVDALKVARPRLPIIQNAGHSPGCSELPGICARSSMKPPVKHILFHVCSIAV